MKPFKANPFRRINDCRLNAKFRSWAKWRPGAGWGHCVDGRRNQYEQVMVIKRRFDNCMIAVARRAVMRETV